MRPVPLALGLLSLAGTLAAGPAPAARADEITVFAAASLKTALDRIAADWQKGHGDRVTVSYGGSSRLARQIQEGAPADVFISASGDWMDAVRKSGDIRPETRRDILGNRLVLVGSGSAPPASLTDLPAMLGEGRLAMALVDSVPAGQYGKQALEWLGLWDEVADQVAQAGDVRAALRLVAAGEVPFGIVYGSDALAEPRVTVVATFPTESHDPIAYPGAVTTQADSPQAAAFLDSLTQEPARSAFTEQGFTVLP